MADIPSCVKSTYSIHPAHRPISGASVKSMRRNVEYEGLDEKSFVALAIIYMSRSNDPGVWTGFNFIHHDYEGVLNVTVIFLRVFTPLKYVHFPIHGDAMITLFQETYPISDGLKPRMERRQAIWWYWLILCSCRENTCIYSVWNSTLPFIIPGITWWYHNVWRKGGRSRCHNQNPQCHD